MKKATLLACAALLAGQSMMAQNNSNEVTYVEDASIASSPIGSSPVRVA